MLADPANHPALDGSGMLRVTPGQLFDCTEAAPSVRDAVEDGQSWVAAMVQTLERLAAIVERPSSPDMRGSTLPPAWR